MRSKKIIVIAHCCLNQNAVLPAWERARGAYPFMEVLVQKGYGILQLPCPETLALGICRPPMNYDDYNTTEHRKLCERLCDIPVQMIRRHHEAGDTLVGMIGIQDSPNCAISGRRGVFMEILLEQLEKVSLPLPRIEVPVEYSEGKPEVQTAFLHELDQWIKEND
ncbi:CD3072 family TudS-related putative desulfidase [Trichococcus flocculiformis]